MVLWRSLRREQADKVTRALYGAVVEQARHPRFFTTYGVPDTLDGRFEMIALHAHLLFRRLGREKMDPAVAALSQSLFDLMFADMDQSLREMGVGDLSVGKKIRAMAAAFYGRAAAYDVGLDSGEAELTAALRRNLYGTIEPDEETVARMVAYVRFTDDLLAGQPIRSLLRGELHLAPPPDSEAA